jgi:prepilin-type N-terminal cleavage/methylation domain-containing protein
MSARGFNFQGFTLVEILVVLAITVVLGGVAYANFGSFREDQALNNAVLDLGNIIHLAQTNSISAVKCANIGDATWSLDFKTNRTDIDLKCITINASGVPSSPTVVKTLKFQGVTISSIDGFSCNSSFQSASVPYVITASFVTLYGSTSFQDAGSACLSTSPTLQVTLKDTKTATTKVITLNKGGGLDP